MWPLLHLTVHDDSNVRGNVALAPQPNFIHLPENAKRNLLVCVYV